MSKARIGIVDYKAQNLMSVERAVRYCGYDVVVSDDASVLAKTDKLIFPGVGAAGKAMDHLRSFGLDSFLKEFAASGKPLLGICLGGQVLLEWSEESGGTSCLGIIPGAVKRLPSGAGLKVPQIGWNGVVPVRDHYLFDGIAPDASFYFVHSYYYAPEVEADVLARTDYGIAFASAIERGNLLACQFHPEKSGPCGLRLISNFLGR